MNPSPGNDCIPQNITHNAFIVNGICCTQSNHTKISALTLGKIRSLFVNDSPHNGCMTNRNLSLLRQY